MTTKWNLINLDLVPLLDKFSAEEEEGKLFLGMCSAPPHPPRPLASLSTAPTLHSIRLFAQVEKAKGRMGSDNATAPVE